MSILLYLFRSKGIRSKIFSLHCAPGYRHKMTGNATSSDSSGQVTVPFKCGLIREDCSSKTGLVLPNIFRFFTWTYKICDNDENHENHHSISTSSNGTEMGVSLHDRLRTIFPGMLLCEDILYVG